MKKFKQFVASLLAVIMVFGLMPVAALAEEPFIWSEQPAAEQPADEALEESAEPAIGEIAFDEGTAEDAQEVAAQAASSFLRIFHLDCGRKYFSVSEIEGIIDQLAENHFTHIQLAFGNDGFRFLLNDMSLEANGNTYASDNVKSAIKSGNTATTSRSSGELSEEEMDTIIAYATEKGISVIPMLNAPGHMSTIVKAMGTLGVSSKYINATGSVLYDGRTTNYAIDPTDEKAVNFVKALVTKYVQYFAGKGCTMFNIGADESGLSTSNYLSYAKFVNALVDVVKGGKMTTLAYNDGIYNTKYSDALGDYEFSTDIVICYWTSDNSASASDLATKGFKILNNTNDWYYVLGDALKDLWHSDQWSYASAKSGLQNTKVMQVKDDTTGVVPIGSVLCLWCDAPGYTYESAKVYDLIKTMAEANPDYFKAEEIPAEPELVVKSVEGEPKAVKQADGSYNVSVKANDTVTITLENSTASLNWSSNDETVATVKDGKVTFTGKAGTVTIAAEILTAEAEAAAVKTDAASSYAITFNVKERTSGDLIDIPEYKEGKVSGSGSSSEYKYILDTDGVDVGEKYLIVAATSEYAMRNNSGVTRQNVTISGTEATIDSSYVDSSLWQFSGATSGTIKNGSSYLRHNDNSLSVSTRSSNTSWNIANNGDGTYTISYDSNDWYGTTSYYLYYRSSNYNSGFSLTSYTYNNVNVRLFKQVAGTNYTVDATSLKELIAYADGLDSSSFSNWEEAGVADALAAAKAVQYEASYADENSANTAQTKINNAAQVLYDALSALKTKKSVDITVRFVDEEGNALISGGMVFKAYDNGNGGYDYDISKVLPAIGGYKYLSGPTIGTVTEETTITLTYKKSDFTIEGAMEIPITIVDYRADGLLFEYDISGNSFAYQLVHTYDNDGSSSTAAAAIDGTQVTSLEPKDNQSTSNQVWHQWNGAWIRTGMVEKYLGANGMPVYTEATVEYVASKLAKGYIADRSSSAKNWNDILYNTFVKSGATRSVRNTVTNAFSDAFKNSKTYDNITNAYDLAWYLLNTLYIGDTNMAEVTDNVNGGTYTLPIYGMADSTYNKLILVQDDDGTYYMKAYTDGAKLKYDEANGAIYNSSVDNSNDAKFMYPLCGKGYDKYLGDNTDNTSAEEATDLYPVGVNGNYTLRSESQFVYSKGTNQYFEFTGDDDVYLFINGKLVLDLGGAHWSLSKTVYMDEIAEKCDLKNGEVATFTFFYMERFSDCSNFGIRTNLELVRRGIEVEKNGYDTSYSTDRASGSVVENGKSIAYDLVVTNKGDVPMEQIKLEDTDSVGASISLGFGVDTPVLTEGNGAFKLSELDGYVLFITNAAGVEVDGTRVSYTTLAELSAAVADITLLSGQSLHVRFLKVTANVLPSKIEHYTNTIKVTAVSKGQTLTDSEIHEIYSYNANDTAKDYVVDFGLPLKIENMFDAGSKDYFAYPDKKLEMNTAQSSVKYGEVKISGTGFGTVLTYTLKQHVTIDAVETIVLNVAYKFGNNIINLQKTIRIIPASTVYYEDDLVTFKNSNGNTGVATTEQGIGTWYTVGTKPTETIYQALDKLGDEAANNYGFDKAYEECSQYSLGSATKVTVDNSISADSCPSAKFTFKGTGFDIISLTDSKSGAIYVDIYKGNSTSDRVKGFFVNNYYGYKVEGGKWVVDYNADNNALYQIPVMKVSGLEYGTYTVVVNVRYYDFQDVQHKGSYSFWFDAIRIYDPAGTTAINTDYTKDGEGYPQYLRLRNELVAGKASSKVVFIDGGDVADISIYRNYGPNNEVYLAAGQAISFQINVGDAQVDSVQIGAKSPTGTAEMDVNGTKTTIATATEMYYGIDVAKDGTKVVITNTGSNVLSLTNIKVTFKKSATVKLAEMTDAQQTEAAMAVRALFAPVVFAPETFTVKVNGRKTGYTGEPINVSVTTSDDVDYITVNGQVVTRYYEERTWGGFRRGYVTTGNRIWSYTAKFGTAGEQTISAVAYNSEDIASEAVESTVTVKERPRRGFFNWFN